ncbi:MAG: hypothetical protein ACK583_02005 [Cyanobacteriota bacterium]
MMQSSLPVWSVVTASTRTSGEPPPAGRDPVQAREQIPSDASQDPVLCSHCGRTAKNGIVCQGICVADSGY